jgi:hypothetical protein
MADPPWEKDAILLTTKKSTYLEGDVFEVRLRLKDAILDPPLRLEVAGIRAPYVRHASHAIRMKHNSIPFPHYCPIWQYVVCHSLFGVLHDQVIPYCLPTAEQVHYRWPVKFSQDFLFSENTYAGVLPRAKVGTAA